MIRAAAIDIGSNSMKLLIADLGGGALRAVIDRFRVTRLGEGTGRSRRLGEDAAKRNLETLRLFAGEARDAGAERIVAAGTEALRAARNADSFLERARAACGLEVEILPGEEEARLCWIAALSHFGPVEGSTLLFDTGGGSTEFVLGSAGEMESRRSLPLGSRNLTERHLLCDPPSPEERDRLDRRLRLELARLEGAADRVIGSGGTAVVLASVRLGLEPFDPSRAGAARLTAADIDEQSDLYFSLSLEERRGIAGLPPERADVIPAGARIVREVLRRFGAAELLVTDRGLRHGLLIDRFLRR